MILDQWDPLNKLIPLMEDLGGGGGVHGSPSGPMDYVLFDINNIKKKTCPLKFEPTELQMFSNQQLFFLGLKFIMIKHQWMFSSTIFCIKHTILQ